MNNVIKFLGFSLLISGASILFASGDVDPLDAMLASETATRRALEEEIDRIAQEKAKVAAETAAENLRVFNLSVVATRKETMDEQEADRKLIADEFRYAQFVLVPLDKGVISGYLSEYYSATHERARQESMGSYSMRDARGEDSVDPETFLVRRKGNNRERQNVFVHEGTTYLKLSRDRWLPGSNLFEQYVASTYDNNVGSSIVKHAMCYTVTAHGTPADATVTIAGLPHLVLSRVELRVTKKSEDFSHYD